MEKKWSDRLAALIREKKIKKEQMLLLLLTGILLLVITFPGGKEKKVSGEEEGDSLLAGTDTEEGADLPAVQETYVSRMEKKLAGMLARMDGAGEVSVMMTLASSAEKVVEKDTESEGETVTEKDSQGGNRTTQNESLRESVVYGTASGDAQSPYVRKELTPRVEGVVVLSTGADDPVVVKNITEAVQALFGIDTHKIRIVKGRRAKQ